MFVFVVRQLIVIAIIFMGTGIHIDLTFSEHNANLNDNNVVTKNFLTEITDSYEKYNTSVSKNFSTTLHKEVSVETDKQLDFGQTDYYSAIPGFRYLKLKDTSWKKILINKCCPENFYFDIDSLRCLQFNDTIFSFYSFRNFTNNILNADNATKYIFIEKVPDCGDGSVLSIQTKTSVNISSNGIVLDGESFTNYCVQEKYLFFNETIVLTCANEKQICNKKSCFRKCCPLRESYGLAKTCQKFDDPFTLQIYDLNTLTPVNSTSLSDYGIIYGDGCGARNKFFLEKDVEGEAYFGIDGYLYVPSYQQKFSKNEFCLEYVEADNDSSEVGFFLCFEGEDTEIQFLLHTIAFSISCLSLLLTFIVYLFLPKFQNCYGKSLMCYVACLFTAYLCLAIINYPNELDKNTCTNLGYTVLFSFLAAFFWLNVMSFDIWKTFSTDRSLNKPQLQEEKIRFLYYSIYAWTFPCVITAACAAINQWEDFPYPLLHPHIGDSTCWFTKGTSGIYFFFIAPASLVMSSNIVFYVRTAVKIWRVKSEVSKMEKKKKKKFIANKDQFRINCKLFIVMGITWSLEIISAVLPHPIWHITDTINALHGVFIFAIFLLKKKVIELIQEKMRYQLKKIRQFSIRNRTSDTEVDSKRTENKENINVEEKSSSSEGAS